jgi:hypothetical protein
MKSSRKGSVFYFLAGMLLWHGSACIEVPSSGHVSEQDERYTQALARPYTPQKRPRLEGRGPVVPGTPGLRVPSGFFARVRIQVMDFYQPLAMASFLRTHGEVYLRLVTEGGGENDSFRPMFRAIIPITLPKGSGLQALTNLTLGKAALDRATATFQLTPRGKYLVKVERLHIETIEDVVITGALEGRAMRGSLSKTSVPFMAGFVALRGPDTGTVEPRKDHR